MRTLKLVKQSWSLFGARDRRILGVITLAQMMTSFLDLLGVMLLGVVGVLSVAVVSGAPVPDLVSSVLSRLGGAEVGAEVLAAWFCMLAGFLLVLKSGVSAFLTRRTLRFLANRQAILSARLTRALLARPIIDIQARASQDIAFVITIATQSATVGILGAATTALADLFLLAVLAIGLTAIDPVVTIFAVVFFSLMAVGLQHFLSGWASRLGKESAEADIEAYMAIQEAIASYREISVTNRRFLYAERIRRLRWKAATVNADSQFMILVPKFAFEIALVFGGLALAISQVASKDIVAAVGIVSIFLIASLRVMPAVLRLQVASLSIRRAEAPASKAFELIRDLESSGVPSTSDPAANCSGPINVRRTYPDFLPTLSVEGLSMRYPGSDIDALTDVSFTAGEGTSVAFVGATGAGKSTLADCILGVAKPDVGSVRIGGISPVAACSRWPGGITYVPQNVAVVNGTVRQNVALGLPPDAFEDEWVWEALRRAKLASFLLEQREGLETLVGENGMRLSGGQRQRLGIARALFTHPRLLVLDEATSSLDADTEASIGATMRDLEGSVTTVTIAHRLATIRHCDLVLYLEHGHVVARGSFDSVRRQSTDFDRQATLLGL